jgi:hypothetical protein
MGLLRNTFFVIASEAKQSICALDKGLLRRFSPRNDSFALLQNSPIMIVENRI